VINPLVVKNNDVAVLFAEFAYGVQMDLRSWVIFVRILWSLILLVTL
jgi:hypothetical protein